MTSNLRKSQVAGPAKRTLLSQAISFPTPKFPLCHWPTCEVHLALTFPWGALGPQMTPKKNALCRTGVLSALLAESTVRIVPPQLWRNSQTLLSEGHWQTSQAWTHARPTSSQQKSQTAPIPSLLRGLG